MNEFLNLVKVAIEAKNHSVVKEFNVSNRAISYDGVDSKEKIDALTEEEAVRAYLLARLVADMGYKVGSLELEKRYSHKMIGRQKTIKEGAESDILVKDTDGNPFLFIEVKAPHEFDPNDPNIETQLFNTAEEEEKQYKTKVRYLVYYSLDALSLAEKAIVIDFQKFRHYDDWLNAGSPSTDTIPARFEKAQKEPYKRNGLKSLRTKVTKQEVATLQRNLHNVLWGGGGTNDSEIFYSLVNLILAKIQDEHEKENGDEYDFQVKQYGDETEDINDLFQRVNALYRRALREKLNKTENLDDQFVVNNQKFPFAKLRYTVSQLESISLTEARDSLEGKDILGDLFEGITRDGFKQTKGQFFTPMNIVRFMLYGGEIDKMAIEKLNNARKLPHIIDPSCGSGTFLIEAMKIISKEVGAKQRHKVSDSTQVQNRLNELVRPEQENYWAREYLYGLEHNFDLGTAVKVNMILHGDGSANIFVKDGLLPFRDYKKEHEPNVLRIAESDELISGKEVNSQFDIVVTNPPFSVNLDNETKRSLPKNFLFSDKKNSENLFIERYYQLLKEGGRLFAVLPESVFDTTENSYIRLFLFKYFHIRALVSLPQVSFEPYTSTKTSIVFAQKKNQSEVEAWNREWDAASREFSKLKTRVENAADVYLRGKDKKKLPSIEKETEVSLKEMSLSYLRHQIEPGDEKLDLSALLTKHAKEIKEIGKPNKSLSSQFGFSNIWWVFSEVAAKSNESIFMADAENVGYKRTTVSERLMPNDLFEIEAAPLFLKIDEIEQIYLSEIENIEADINQLKDRIKKCEKEKDSEQIERLKPRLEKLIARLNSTRMEQGDTLEKLDEYYKDGQLKAEHADRTSNDLRRLFDLPLIKHVKSYDVALREHSAITILDSMRQAKIWH